MQLKSLPGKLYPRIIWFNSSGVYPYGKLVHPIASAHKKLPGRYRKQTKCLFINEQTRILNKRGRSFNPPSAALQSLLGFNQFILQYLFPINTHPGSVGSFYSTLCSPVLLLLYDSYLWFPSSPTWRRSNMM